MRQLIQGLILHGSLVHGKFETHDSIQIRCIHHSVLSPAPTVTVVRHRVKARPEKRNPIRRGIEQDFNEGMKESILIANSCSHVGTR